MDEIENLQAQLLQAQRDLFKVQQDFVELMKGYNIFDDIQESLNEIKRANEEMPKELTDKIEEIMAAVERRKTL